MKKTGGKQGIGVGFAPAVISGALGKGRKGGKSNFRAGPAVRFGLRRFSAAFLFLILDCGAFPPLFCFLFVSFWSAEAFRPLVLCLFARFLVEEWHNKRRRKRALLQNETNRKQKQKSGGKAPQSKTDGCALDTVGAKV